MLTRFDPFQELDRVRRTFPAFTAMPMDAYRRDDRFIVELDLPGVAREAIDVTVEDRILQVSAERTAPLDDAHVLLAERPRGTMTRQLLLDRGVDADRIDASYHDGVLRLTMPIAEEAKPHRIAIASGGGREAVTAGT